MDLLTGAEPPSAICRERKITGRLLYRWKNEMLERLPGIHASPGYLIPAARSKVFTK
jgi:hypothetical protein